MKGRLRAAWPQRWPAVYMAVLGVEAVSRWAYLLVVRACLTAFCGLTAFWYWQWRRELRTRRTAEREAEILRTRARVRDASWLN